MQNEFANRQNMHLTVLKLIDTPEYQAAWKNQKPTAFTSRAAQLRPRFQEIGLLLKKMDRLVLRFRRTESGTAFAAAWSASRIIRDLGTSIPAEPEPATPAA